MVSAKDQVVSTCHPPNIWGWGMIPLACSVNFTMKSHDVWSCLPPRNFYRRAHTLYLHCTARLIDASESPWLFATLHLYSASDCKPSDSVYVSDVSDAMTWLPLYHMMLVCGGLDSILHFSVKLVSLRMTLPPSESLIETLGLSEINQNRLKVEQSAYRGSHRALQFCIV